MIYLALGFHFKYIKKTGRYKKRGVEKTAKGTNGKRKAKVERGGSLVEMEWIKVLMKKSVRN